MIRSLSIGDLVELEKYSRFPLENVRTRPKVIENAIEDEKGLLGCVIVDKTSEVSVVLSDERSMRDKIKALKCIENLLLNDLRMKGYSDVHVFSIDSEYTEVLVKHFGFEYRLGQALIRRR
jgi:hypothetical protein